jgi:subtilisin-like proprotein convertase family protein
MGFGARTTSPNATRATASFASPHLVEDVASAYDDSGAFGDGDGVAEPGELLRFAMQLENPGVVPLTNVHGTLSSATSGAAVVVPDAGFGTIAAGDSSANATDYVLTLAPALACGSQVQLTLHVTSDQGSIDVPLVLPLGAGDSVFSASDGSRAIPDDVPTGGAVSSLTVPSGGRIDHLRVTVNVTHTFVGDLHAWLTSPHGPRVDLLEQPGFSSIDWNGPVTFDDGAFNAIQDIPPSGAPLSGSFIPNEPLATFAGEDRAGIWRLRIADDASADVGTLNGWSIDTDQPSCSTSTTLPVATTGDATGLSTSGATLAGSIDPGGAETTYRFEYGPTSAYGQTTATASAGAGSGAVGESAAVSGLAAATTYHFRVVAFRDGIQVAAGADGTFSTTTSGSIGPPLRPLPPPRRVTPGVSSLTRRARVNARGAFVFAFHATPGLSGSVRFTLPKRGRVKAIVFGRRSFTVPGSGRVRLTLKLSRRALAQLRRRHRATVRVTIKLGGATFARRLTLVVARPRR